MYKAFIEPDLRTAQIKIINKFNPFTGFQSPTYILKVPIRTMFILSNNSTLYFVNLIYCTSLFQSSKKVTEEQIKSVMSEEHEETTEQIYDIYLLPPGEDSETCQSYLRMRNKDGKYNLMFEVYPDHRLA